MTEIKTSRLVLRQWRAEDLGPFAAMNADPAVMAWFPAPLSRTESDRLAGRIAQHFKRHEFGLWALEIPGVTRFAGFVGLSVPAFDAPFTPCVEIGWRLGRLYWGHGYATEAASAARDFGFESLALNEIVSFTTTGNRRSEAVMRRLAMQRDPADDFDHPMLPEHHPLRRHVLYRQTAAFSRVAASSETAQ